MEQPNIHPLNAAGDFFVENDMCLACDAPRMAAPELMSSDESGHCYFKRQPRTPEEFEHAVEAVQISCIEAVRYKGSDPDILRRVGMLPCFNRVKYSTPFSEVEQPESLWQKLLALFKWI